MHSSSLHGGGEAAISAVPGQDMPDEGLDFPLELSDIQFNIDDMFWLNASAADIIF